jgi:hypothetical protein
MIEAAKETLKGEAKRLENGKMEWENGAWENGGKW